MTISESYNLTKIFHNIIFMFWPETLLFWFTAFIVLFLATAVGGKKTTLCYLLSTKLQTKLAIRWTTYSSIQQLRRQILTSEAGEDQRRAKRE